MNALTLLLLDSRAPTGASAHSAGLEAAVEAGWVRDLDDLAAFCAGRLRTSGRVAAAFAAAACADPASWRELDDEFEARTASEAMRTASRALGAGLRRLLRAMVPAFAATDREWGAVAPHHPIVLGVACALTGATPGRRRPGGRAERDHHAGDRGDPAAGPRPLRGARDAGRPRPRDRRARQRRVGDAAGRYGDRARPAGRRPLHQEVRLFAS